MNEVHIIARPIHEQFVETLAAERTLYVHLCSGEIIEVACVSEVYIGQTELVLHHGEAEPTIFPRRLVYFASPERDDQPSPF